MTSIVITGGLGFLGQNLARAILQRTTTPLTIKLVDIPNTNTDPNSNYKHYVSQARRLIHDFDAKKDRDLMTHVHSGLQSQGLGVTTGEIARIVDLITKKYPTEVYHRLGILNNILGKKIVENLNDGTSTIEIVLGDISDPSFCDQVIDQNTTSVYHLAAAMSGACETDPTLAMQTNVLGTMNLLSSVKKRSSSSSSSSPPTFVFASSGAVFGTNEGVVSDTTKLLPETTYGMTKSICEMLINGQSLYACLSPPLSYVLYTLAFNCTD